ncbi:DUF721 domain-containing protein [Alphaproteobacteria bacterium LSUCC0684]
MEQGRNNSKRGNRAARLNTITSRLLSPALRSRGITMGRIVTEWKKIAGPCAEWCDPMTIQFPRGQSSKGTLTLAVVPGRGPEIQMQIPEIIRNCNAVFGYAALERITMTQGRFDKGKPATATEPPRRLSPEDASSVAETAPAIAGIRDDGLRKALDNLGKSLTGDAPKDNG